MEGTYFLKSCLGKFYNFVKSSRLLSTYGRLGNKIKKQLRLQEKGK